MGGSIQYETPSDFETIATLHSFLLIVLNVLFNVKYAKVDVISAC